MPIRVYVLALGAFSLITTEFGIIGMLPQLAEAFGVTVEHAAWLLSGFAITIALSGPFMTLLFSGVNRKLAFGLVLACFVAVNLVSALIDNFNTILVLRILSALLHPVFWSVAIAVAAASVPEKDSPRAISIVFAGLSAGTVLGVPLAAYFTDGYGWQAGFLTFAVLNGVSLVALIALLPSLPVTERLSFASQLGVLRKPALWANLVVLFLIMASTFAIYGYFAEYMTEVVGLSGARISVMLLLFGVAGFVGNLAAGRLIGVSLPGTVFAFIIGLAAILAILGISGGAATAIALIVIVWGFIHSAGFLLGQSIVGRVTTEAPEFGNALFASLGNAGVAVGTFLGGIVIAGIGTQSLPFATICLLALTAVGFVIAQRLSR